MKIGPFNIPSSRTTANGESTAAARPSSKGTAGTRGADAPSAQVALSPAASLITGGDASFDADKVQRITQAIRDGSFRINAGAIADKLLDNAQELLARSPH